MRTRTVLEISGFIALVGWIGYSAMGTNVFGRQPWPNTMVDYRLLYDYSRQVVTTQIYPTKYAYPPPAVVMQYATTAVDFPIAAAVYLGVNMVAVLASFALLRSMLKLQSWFLTFLAFVVVAPFFNWELRSQNCNGIFVLTLLLAVRGMLKNHAISTGGFLALSVALKLFSIFVVPYLLWTRQWRAFVCFGISTVLLWYVMPTIVFGSDNLDAVYSAWLGQMADNAKHDVDFIHPILISLQNSAYWLSNGNTVNASWIVRGVWLAWLVLGLMGAWSSWIRPSRDHDGILADVSLLVLGPISLSPYLETYHPVVGVIPAMLLISVASRASLRFRIRAVASLFFTAGLVLSVWPTPWQARGLWVNLDMFLLVGGSVLVAHLKIQSEHGDIANTILTQKRQGILRLISWQWFGRLLGRKR